jgi:hypothetical protein
MRTAIRLVRRFAIAYTAAWFLAGVVLGIAQYPYH